MSTESKITPVAGEVGESGEDDLIRKRYQAEAVAAIAGRMAHELNNLFTLVNGSIWRIGQVVDGGSEVAAEVEELRKSVDMASSLTRNLLAYSRQQVLEPRITDLSELVDRLLPTLREIAGEGIEVIRLREDGRSPARVDGGQLAEAVVAVVENARAAMPDGGLLTIETSEAVLDPAETDRYVYPVAPGRYARLTISDTGRGMTREVVERAFEPFFTTRAVEGHFGLGLSSAYGIVKQSGGYLWIDSEEEVGTVVSIFLPWAEGEEAEPLGSQPAALPALRASGPATILVVEDNPSVRSMVVRLLMRRGFSVVEAADGREALAIAEAYPAEINLLLTDVMMPHMDGRELVESLRLSRPDLRVLYMSGYAQKASMRTHYIASTDAFVAKPFDPDALVDKVLEVLSHLR